MKKIFALLLFCSAYLSADATILHVGPAQTYTTLGQAAAAAKPGDTIMIQGGTYSGGTSISDLQGTSTAVITIMPAPGDTVIYSGGSNGWHLTDAAYLRIYNIIFEKQTGNGFNIDDGGSYATPTHHVLFERCTFRNINATGNNDLLKLSGLDNFELRSCVFVNGAAGGSGADMVGCHNGVFKNCHFENMGSNAIQAKGGTQHILMEGNFFKNCGQRAVNLGGSTGLAFFRPIDAPFEAADLQVYSNVFIGSTAPIAYVGCVRVQVINNTIYNPGNWVIRILQETVDTARFAKCGDNTFRNNIIYRGSGLSTDCNVGSNTDPKSFHFSNNLWYHYQNSSWTGPNLPVVDSNNIIGSNPLFKNIPNEDFSIGMSSPAAAKGYTLVNPVYDRAGNAFAPKRSIGAYEADIAAHTLPVSPVSCKVFPNPFNTQFQVQISNGQESEIILYDIVFRKQLQQVFTHSVSLSTAQIPAGIYMYQITDKTGSVWTGKVMKE
jgi:hypothetical protein